MSLLPLTVLISSKKALLTPHPFDKIAALLVLQPAEPAPSRDPKKGDPLAKTISRYNRSPARRWLQPRVFPVDNAIEARCA